jgi:hypothetical protein
MANQNQGIQPRLGAAVKKSGGYCPHHTNFPVRSVVSSSQYPRSHAWANGPLAHGLLASGSPFWRAWRPRSYAYCSSLVMCDSVALGWSPGHLRPGPLGRLRGRVHVPQFLDCGIHSRAGCGAPFESCLDFGQLAGFFQHGQQ